VHTKAEPCTERVRERRVHGGECMCGWEITRVEVVAPKLFLHAKELRFMVKFTQRDLSRMFLAYIRKCHNGDKQHMCLPFHISFLISTQFPLGYSRHMSFRLSNGS